MIYPLVSICIPNYNNEAFLDQCLQSALKVNYSNKEIILYDDNSTDNSIKIAQKYSPEIKIIQNPINLGQPANTNKCIRESNGKYLVILHSDDYLLPNFISDLISILEKHPQVAYAVGERLETNEVGTETKIKPFYNTNCIVPGVKQAKVFMMTSFLPCQVLLRREIFNKIGGINENHIVNLDGLLWFTCSLYGDMGYIQTPVAAYRSHPKSTTSQYNQTIDHMIEYYATLKEMIHQANGINYIQDNVDTAILKISHLCVRYCHDAFKARNYTLVRKYLALAQVFDLSIVEDDIFQLLNTCLNSKNEDPYSYFLNSGKELQKIRDFSYSPPEGYIEI